MIDLVRTATDVSWLRITSRLGVWFSQKKMNCPSFRLNLLAFGAIRPIMKQ